MTIHITTKHLHVIESQIERLLNKNIAKIDESYTKNDNEISLSLSVKMAPNKVDGIDIKVDLSFVESRVKESTIKNVPDKQGKLFDSIEFRQPLALPD